MSHIIKCCVTGDCFYDSQNSFIMCDVFYTSMCVVFITLICYTDKFSRKQPAIPIKEGCVATTEAMEVAACFGW